jgi:hypothetical protein
VKIYLFDFYGELCNLRPKKEANPNLRINVPLESGHQKSPTRQVFGTFYEAPDPPTSLICLLRDFTIARRQCQNPAVKEDKLKRSAIDHIVIY